MFIDLPSPWMVINKAKKVLKNGSYFVSFSPCIEQINETMKTMKENGFISLIHIISPILLLKNKQERELLKYLMEKKLLK